MSLISVAYACLRFRVRLNLLGKVLAISNVAKISLERETPGIGDV